MPLPPACSVFALLDDALACAQAPEHPASRLYTGHLHTHRCHRPADLDTVCAAVQADLAQGRHGVLLANHEWGAHLQDPQAPLPPGAALQVLVFARLTWLNEAGVQAFLHQEAGATDTLPPSGVLHLRADETPAQTEAAVRQIQAAIRDGAVYQVNHTHRLQGRAYGPPAALYRRLRARQPVGYGAFIALPAGLSDPSDLPDGPHTPDHAAAHTPGGGANDRATHVLSASPELFVRVHGGQVTARPMKGTTPRGANAAEDAALAQALAQDPKNRAENLMIVDLLRNDLGRVAELGSVQVPRLFEVAPYATLQQMTSTVQARLRSGVGLAELLRATFPCGSITGAPKLAALAQIRRLERSPRGLYCGAIGWLAPCPAPAADVGPPAPPALGDLCLSVAIRTLVLGAEAADGTRALTAGVGAGIVQDSVPADEVAECQLKARFLTRIDPGLGLFETLKVVRPAEGALPLALAREQHLARLARSAQALGFAWAHGAAQAALDQALHTLHASGQPGPWRLRLDLAADGTLRSTSAALPPLATDATGRVRLGWAHQVLPAGQALAAHKTTHRAHYDAAVRQAEARGWFDLLFTNTAARVVEGGRSSLFVCIDGRWHTPPVADGALPGICRAQVLAQGLPPPPMTMAMAMAMAQPDHTPAPPWVAGSEVTERALSVHQVQQAQAWAVGNALRGVVPAWLVV